MEKEPITIKGLEKLKKELILLKEKIKKNGQRKIRKFSMRNGVDMLNSIYFMIKGQNLDYKQVEM